MTTREVVLDGGSPWGFRMHGGADVNQPLRISRVNPGSKAALRGIREGDFITSINGQGTRDISNAEAHSLLKNAGDSLVLGLNEEYTGSPKRRQYKTVHQETHSETVKKSSVTTYSIKSSQIVETLEPKQGINNEINSIGQSNEKNSQVNGKDSSDKPKLATNGFTSDSTSTLTDRGTVRNNSSDFAVASQRSSYSNLSPSTASTLTEDGKDKNQHNIDAMADNGTSSKSRRRRARNNRKKNKNKQCDAVAGENEDGIVETHTSIHIKEEEETKIDYRVESPEDVIQKLKTKEVVKQTSMVKSKSLDNDEILKIQELSDASESELKGDNQAIVSEASESEVDWEETDNFDIPEAANCTLSSLSLPLEDYQMEEVTLISPEEELTLRNFLEGLNLVNSPEDAVKQTFEISTADSIKARKAKKRAELEQYFLPMVNNPRYLDVISEEASDQSDKEVPVLRQHLKQGTPELDNPKDNKPPVPTRRRRRTVDKSNYQISNPAVLVGTKIIDTPPTITGVQSTLLPETSNVEVVYLSSSESPETLSDYEECRDEITTTASCSTESLTEPTEQLTEKCSSEIIVTINVTSQSDNLTKTTEKLDEKISEELVSACDATQINITNDKKVENISKEILIDSANKLSDQNCDEHKLTNGAEIKSFNEDMTYQNNSNRNCSDFELSSVLKKNTESITQFTPPPTPENSPKSESINGKDSNLLNFADKTLSLLSTNNKNELQEIIKDEQFLLLPDEIKIRVRNAVRTNNVIIPEILSVTNYDGDVLNDEISEPLHAAMKYSNVISPPPPSRSPSPSSGSSSIDTSLSTAKYNPMNSSVGDMSTFTKEDEATKDKPFLQPLTLREQCLKYLISMPFGEEILQELAEVSLSIESFTSNLPGSLLPKIAPNLPAYVYNKNLKDNNSESSNFPVQPCNSQDMPSSGKWVGMPTEKDPKLLICLSPKQKEELEKSKRVQDEAGKLLDLHEKFISRRIHNDVVEKYDENVKITTINKCNSNISINTPNSPSHRLLAIIREEPSSESAVMETHDGKDDSNYLHFDEINPRQFLNKKSATLPRNKVIEPSNMFDDARLKAKDLSEWLQLARHRSMSESNISSAAELKCESPLVSTNNTLQSQNTFYSMRRRTSLPQELYERQLQYLLEKERDVQRELERLEEEKIKLASEMAPSREFQPDDYHISRKGDYAVHNENKECKTKARPASMSAMPTEFFRQQMYEEYMNQIAVREERKQLKVIKVSSSKPNLHQDENQEETLGEVQHIPGIEEEFMEKLKQKKGVTQLTKEDSVEPPVGDIMVEDGEPVLVIDGESLKDSKQLPKHLQEFIDITKQARDSILDTSEGIWSPGQRQEFSREERSNKKDENESIPPVWTPKSANSSPVVERKEFKPVNFQSPVLSRRNKQSTESIGTPDSAKSEPPWKIPDSSSEVGIALSSSLEKRLPTSHSLPASGFSDFTSPRLPKAQNPTITLLQKAREGQLPRGAHYIDQDQSQNRRLQNERHPGVSPVYTIKNEYISDSESERPRKITTLGPRQFQGIGPTTKDGMPLILRSEVRDSDQSKWYKKMYDTIHKQKPHNTQYPYASGYLSEPEPGAYDSDFADYKYATLDRRRTPYKERDHDYNSPATMPRNMPNKSASSSDVLRNGQDLRPGRIENYTPGHSSISEKEAKEWWDEVMDIFDGHLEQQKRIPAQPKSFINQALKESGYESDSTLVFRRKEETSQLLSPKDQKEAYKTIQKGGDVPFHGLRKPAPERPQDEDITEYMSSLSNIPTNYQFLQTIKPQKEILCYPVTVHNTNTFANYKRSAPSSSQQNIPNPPTLPPPSPPRRKSSRNNSTLRLISTMKVKSEKSPTYKRHETCFATTSNKDKSNIKYLRDKITCKLSPMTDRKSNLKVYKTITTTPNLKSKITSTLSTSRNPRTSSSRIHSSTNISTSKEGIASARSKSAESERRQPRIFTPTTIRKITKSNDSLNKFKTDSSTKPALPTFGNEKKKFNLPLSKSTSRLNKSTELLSPTEVKKVTAVSKSGPTYKLSTAPLASSKYSHNSKQESLPIKVGITEKGRKLLKSTLQKPASSKSKTSNVKSSLESLRSVRSSASSSDQSLKQKSNSKKTQKSKKDKINDEIAKKTKTKSSAVTKSNPNSTLPVAPTEKQVFHRDSFFRNLFLRNVSPPPVASKDNLWLIQKTNQLQRKKYSVPEPSVGAMKVYLKHTKPVTDSKFLSLDYNYARSRSASPKSVSWRSNENLTEISSKRSLSLPSKVILTQTSRPVSPILRSNVSRSSTPNSTKTYSQLSRRRTPPPPSPKLSKSLPKIILSETVRPRSPLIQRKSRSPSPKLMRSSPAKLVFSETSRPVSPVIERSPTPPPSIVIHSSPNKLIFTETSRPVSPLVERRPKRPPSPTNVHKSPTKLIFTETSRPISPSSPRRLYSPIRKEKPPSLKMIFSETSRPVSPVVERRLRRIPTPPPSPKMARSSSSKLIFTETSRPRSPVVKRKTPTPPSSPKLSRASSSSKLFFTETSRPRSPIVKRKTPPSSPKLTRASSSSKLFFTETSRPRSPIVIRKTPTPPQSPKVSRSPTSSRLIFTETSRPRSPVIRRDICRSSSAKVMSRSYSPTSKIPAALVKSSSLRSVFDIKRASYPLKTTSVTPPSSPKIMRSPSCRKIMHIKSNQANVSDYIGGDKITKSHETTLYMCPNISHSATSLCSESDYQTYVKELVHSSKRGEKFRDLNNFYTEIAKVGELEKKFSLKPRTKSENEIIDYDRWQEVRTRERAERELNSLYRHLKEHEKEKGFLFIPKDVTRYKWKKEFDRGLRVKEKSVDNIKEEFEKLKLQERESRYIDTSYTKDTYKPLWRGNSVINLAHKMTTRRSQSEGRVASARQKLIDTERMLTHGIGSRIWSSLSMEQVNTLKDQLSEIYNQNSTKFNKPVEYSIQVPYDKSQYDSNLTVRRNSDASDQTYRYTKVAQSKPSSVSTSCLSSGKISEDDKKVLSQTLSREVLDVISKRRQTNKVLVGKEILGAVASKEARVKKSDSNKELYYGKATLPVKPLVRTDAINTCKISSTSETDSTDESTKTVIQIKNEDIKNKVEYFENTSDRDIYTPTIYKPADSKYDIGDTISFDSEKKECNTLKKHQSQSCQNLKEMFGENELVKFATIPLAATRKDSKTIPKPPQLRAIDLSPLRTPISGATSYDSLCRSRSLSPFFDEPHALVKAGEVHRLKNRFEHTDNIYNSLSSLSRSQSDSELNREYNSIFTGYVDALRRNYEYPAHSGRGRSRLRRGGVVSPMFLRAEDRFMPHINIISKIASLYTKKTLNGNEKSKSTEELAAMLNCPVGEVHKLKERYENFTRDISLMGHMFTSSPNVKELRDIAPYLAASWMAHRYPKSEDNTRSLSSPDNSVASRDTSLVRKDRLRSKSISPLRHPVKSSILKPPEKRQKDYFQDQQFDPRIHQPVDRYQPKYDPVRYNSHWTSSHSRPSVSFKEPEVPVPPPKAQYLARSLSQESPRKYVENEVTIHYRTPVRQEIKEYLSEDELAHKQAEAMKKIYQEERRRKYLQVSKSLQELQDMNSRRHTDNFIPSQKSPIALNRYDDFDEPAPGAKPRPRTPEPRLVARALYNFVGQTARELTFRKGDLIFVRRQVDKNWFEGELNAMVGLFPVNHVEIVSYDGIKTTTRKSYEGQARAKFNFIAQTHLELSLAKGELVVITRKVDNNWYEGKIGGRKGIFPVSYVEVLIDPQDPPPPSSKPVASPAAHSILLNGSSGGKESMGTHSYTPALPNAQLSNTYQAKPIQITGSGTYGSLNRYLKNPVNQALHIETQSDTIPYRALYKYNPQNDDELELLEGDTVYVLEKCDDGWYVGSSERTGAFGTFPGNYVEKI